MYWRYNITVFHSESIEKSIKVGLKTIAASFPVAASFVQAWDEYESHAQSTRIQEFFNEFGDELVKIKEQLESVKEYIKKSGEIPSLIERTIDKIRKEHSTQKRQMFAHLLASSIAAGTTISYDDKLTFITSLDTLTEQDLYVFSKLQPNKSIEVAELVKSKLFDSITPEEALNKLIVSLSKLESRGIISESAKQHGRIFYGGGVVPKWEEHMPMFYHFPFELEPSHVALLK